MASRPLDGARGIGQLLRELADASAVLVRKEVTLARIELASMVRALGTGTAAIAGGGVLTLLGSLCFFTGLVLLPGDQWLRDRYWLAAVIVMVLTGGVAAVLARRGLALLAPSRLVPDETLETLSEDKEWLKRRLTSGAKSK